MEILADVRCLQDENFAQRGVGFHSSTLLGGGRELLPKHVRLIGLIDPNLPELSRDYQALFDDVSSCYSPSTHSGLAYFLQMSPMTHDVQRCAGLLGKTWIRSCAVVYDFIPLDRPERYLSNPSVASLYQEQLAWLGCYDRYFPISDYSADRLQELYPVRRERVHVTGVAIRPSFERILLANPSTRNFDDSLPYFLFVGGGDPRKKLDILIESFALISTRANLVIVGKYPATEIDRVRERFEKLGGQPTHLRFLSGISDMQLAELYSNALSAVCCSEIEGFSLPVLEAVACHCPIILSENEAHRELVQAPEAFYETDSVEGLRSRLTHMLDASEFREDLLKKQADMPYRFLAKKVCERFWIPLLEDMRVLRKNKVASPMRSRQNRPKLAVITPFPPDASGVADYTRRSLVSIGKLMDVDVYTDAHQPSATEGVRNYYPISNAPYLSNQYDQVLSIIGNSHFHIKMIEMQRIYGGACLIHDNRLAELYSWWKGADYLAQMASKKFGRHVSVNEAYDWVHNPGTLPSVFFDELVPTAHPLIVHSRGIQAQCSKEYGVEPKYLPFCCYRDYEETNLTAEAKRAHRRALGIEDDQIMIISLGIVGKTKAPDVCIQSLRHLHDAGIKAHLHFVGDAAGERAWLEQLSTSLNLASYVHLMPQWTDEATYLRYLYAADFAIQLRNHFFGGLSGAMLDCIGSGLTTVSNDDLAIALDSPSYVLRIRDTLKPEDVANAVESAYRNGVYLDRCNPQRSLYVHDHHFDQYATQLYEILGFGKTDTSFFASRMDSMSRHKQLRPRSTRGLLGSFL